MIKNIAIIGSSGVIGNALTLELANTYPLANINAFSREPLQYENSNIFTYEIDYQNQESIASAASTASQKHALDLVVVTTGILHQTDLMPERSLGSLSKDKLTTLFSINTVLPALVAKEFLPTLSKNNRSIFAALSARVGSISDNHLGGWYSYRMSKAALNMFIKTASLEMHRNNKEAIIVGLHPGTVDSALSKPFQHNVPKEKLFSASFSAQKLIHVLKTISKKDSGKCFDWKCEEIAP